MRIIVKSITHENFRPYGLLVESPTGTPTSQAEDYRFWSDIARYQIEGETEIGICTVYHRPESLITGVERHIRTPEILIPIDAPFVIPLLLPGKDAADLEAFQVSLGAAVVIRDGIWHGACLPVGADESSYFVIFRRHTPSEDVETRQIEPLEIILP